MTVAKQLKELKEMLTELTEVRSTTAVGIVCPDNGLLYTIERDGDNWAKVDKEPEVYLAAKLERVIRSNKRFKVIIGGRGSGKSLGEGDIKLIDAKDTGSKTFFLREFQSSIEDSIQSLLKDEAERLGFDGFEPQQKKILYKGKEAFKFAGIARNAGSIKSAHGFKSFSVEEAQFITEESLTTLTPTVRNKAVNGLPGQNNDDALEESNVSITFVANPGSAEDPFSKRFINPFVDHLDRDGYYEDDMHLVVVMNYTDNPWYKDSGLEEERVWDYINRPRALYDHIWLGKFNDSIDNALIMSEWFDACVDAHKKLGFKPIGAKMAAHDPSDTGPDSKGYAMRHGSVVLSVDESLTGNVNEGGHWAAGLARQQGVDSFTWDCDGMGVALSEQMSRDFEGTGVGLVMFKGSESPDMPEAIYSPAQQSPIAKQRNNKDTFRNHRSQYYYALRDRCYRTYRAVVHGEYFDPNTLISFSSDILCLSKLKSELCRMPVKPNGSGLFELYTKQEMKSKFKVASPNLGDSVMMLMRAPIIMSTETYIPAPIKKIGRR